MHAVAVPTHEPVPGSQQSGGLHALPVLQHGCPVRPHAWHEPPAQTMPLPRHAPPLATHLPLESQQPLVQLLPGQHVPPGLPHAWHAPPKHAVPDVVHEPPFATHVPFDGSQHPDWLHIDPLQHELPGSPQAHVSLAQTYPLEHLLPPPTQTCICGSQHPPAAHVSPEQHAWPTPPQLGPQPPFVLHVSVAGSQEPSRQTSPAQHGWLAPPQVTHEVPAGSQTLPWLQDFLPWASTQHGLPWLPHRTHCPLEQSRPARQELPAQHAVPLRPQFCPPLPHWPPAKGWHVVPLLQVPLAATHVSGVVPVSQHPCVHPPSNPPPPPLQQTWFDCPHGTQVPEMHVAFGSLQLPEPPPPPPPPPLSQHGPPVCPHASHVPASPQTVVGAVQKSPVDPLPLALPGQQP